MTVAGDPDRREGACREASARAPETTGRGGWVAVSSGATVGGSTHGGGRAGPHPLSSLSQNAPTGHVIRANAAIQPAGALYSARPELVDGRRARLADGWSHQCNGEATSETDSCPPLHGRWRVHHSLRAPALRKIGCEGRLAAWRRGPLTPSLPPCDGGRAIRPLHSDRLPSVSGDLRKSPYWPAAARSHGNRIRRAVGDLAVHARPAPRGVVGRGGADLTAGGQAPADNRRPAPLLRPGEGRGGEVRPPPSPPKARWPTHAPPRAGWSGAGA